MNDITVLANWLLGAATVFVLVGLLANIALLSSQRRINAVARRKVAVGDGVQDEKPAPAAAPAGPSGGGLAAYATGFVAIALVLVTVYLAVRWVKAGHGPFGNGHEFLVAFAWGILVAYLVAEWRYKLRVVAFAVLPVVAVALAFSLTRGTEIEPLNPALQNPLLMLLHVGSAIISYGAAGVSFGAAVAFLWRPAWLKMDGDRLDELGYKAATITFPMLTVMILVGAVWGQIAWGRFWSWDPKETAALITWLVYGAYLHARVSRGWQGKGSAWLLIGGFALIIFAYLSSYYLHLGGNHSYA
ncbi:MAG: cytochrome c biogenesis protein CcsA [Micrococcales bacterium]|nr:cytochrome c biogenesis protein CcsA [Micrococcales bacterium]MCL2667391.1 cytochrome c biogenesis protein CcsA [Micrococcales bacterium]